MNLYEINEAIENLVDYGFDTESGEILEGEDLQKKFDELKLDLNEKLVNIACMIKSLDAEAEAIKNEKMKLASRQKAVENKANWLRNYIDNYLKMTVAEPMLPKFKLKDPRAVIGYRKSTVVDITDENSIDEQYLVPQPSKIDKTKIKDDLKAGKEVIGAKLVDKENLSIK